MANQFMDKIPELRKKFLDKHYAADKNYYDKRDISRVKSDDLFVLQFLNGTDGNVDKAHKIMVDGLKLRNTFGVNDLTEKDIHEDVLKSGILFMHGKDKKGTAMLLCEIAKFSWKGDKERTLAYKKLLMYYFEKHQREHPDQKLTLVSECAGSGLANTDLEVSKFSAELLAKVYPDIVESSYVLHFPTLFQALWKVMKGILSTKLTNKYIFPKEEEVSQYIDKDQLPVSFGGESKFVYRYPPEERTLPDDNSNITSEAVVAD